MEQVVQNVIERANGLCYCFSCGNWGAYATENFPKYCGGCYSRSFAAPFEKWVRWYNFARGYVNLPNGRCIRISQETKAAAVLNALRLKYA